MAAHRIRLGAKWRLTIRASSGSAAPAPKVVDLPLRRDDPVLENSTGSIELRRNFNRPGNLDPEQFVWLAVAGMSPQADVTFNGERLDEPATVVGTNDPVRIEISRRLLDYNELLIVVPPGGNATPPNEPIVESVTLEIEPA